MTESRNDVDAGWASQSFGSLVLSSRFQPIVELSSRRVTGYEGLLVATDSRCTPISPEAVFESTIGRAAIHELDFTARSLHMRNFARLGENNGLVFLNVSPSSAVDDLSDAGAFPALMRDCGLEPRDVVVEILEHGIADEAVLADAVDMYKSLGCRVALDDVHTRLADLERIWRLRPQLVKVDRAVTRKAALVGGDLRTLREFVQTLHALGIRVVIEGVENASETAMALEVGADYVQGFHFGTPGRSRIDEHRLELVFADVARLHP